MSTSPELLKTAAHWFVVARSADAKSEEYTAWLAWMEADPEHRCAFEHIQEAWDVASSLDLPPDLQIETSPAPVRQPSRRWRWPAIAASVAVAFLGVAIAMDQWSKRSLLEERIATSRGEHQATVLPDGSHLDLGGLTGVAVNFTRDRRLIVADEGEVFYKVSRDPKRPFVVKTGDVLVTAIGTAFSVRREANIVSVAVEEGAVEINTGRRVKGVSPLRAQAGERIRIDSMHPKSAVRVAESKSSGGWMPGKLRFEGEPLSVVVATLNRYSDREILLGDPSLANLQFSGTIFDDRIAQWLEGVRHLFPIELRNVDSRHVVLERRAATDAAPSAS